MKSSIACAAFMVGALTGLPAGAHDVPWWGYDKMFRSSDLVVIAQAAADTRDTSERTALRDCSPPLRVIGVATDFESLYVLKGPKLKRFTVHHYREVPVHLKPHEAYL